MVFAGEVRQWMCSMCEIFYISVKWRPLRFRQCSGINSPLTTYWTGSSRSALLLYIVEFLWWHILVKVSTLKSAAPRSWDYLWVGCTYLHVTLLNVANKIRSLKVLAIHQKFTFVGSPQTSKLEMNSNYTNYGPRNASMKCTFEFIPEFGDFLGVHMYK